MEAFSSAGGPASAHVEVRELAGHPRLAVVEREGDATPAIAVVANVPGPREALALALALEARLADAGVLARRRVDGTSFSLGFYTTEPARVLTPLRAALAKPIGDADVSRLEAKLATLHVPIAEAFLAETSACEGELALPKGWKHLSAAELEKARAEVFGSAALVVGVVGDAAFADAATKAMSGTEAFPAGRAPSEPAWPSKRGVAAGRLEGVADGQSAIRVALTVPDPRAAVSVAKTFEGEAGAALRAKLERLPVPFTVERVSGVARSRGGCLSVRLAATAPAPDGAMIDAALLAAGIAEGDLEAAAESPADPDVALASVLGASDPIDSAELAAWWSRSTTANGASVEASVAVALAPRSSDAIVARVEAGLSNPVAKSPTDGIQLVTRSEIGQGELWILLANPCAASTESQHQWGSSAAAMLARASEEGRDGVEIEPFVTGDATGIIAHAPPRKGELADDLARRVAGRAAEVMLGGPPSTDDLLRAAGKARHSLERDWGKETLGLDVFASNMSPDHPGAFEPLGSFAGLTKGDVARGAAAWQVVARGPLRLAVLANESASQGPAALAATSRWVLPGAAARCPSEPAGEPKAGHDEVRAEQGAGRGLARAFIGLPLGKGADARSLGEVLRALFDGPASVADTAVHGIDQAKVTARIEGAPAALVVVVEAPDDRLGDAERAVTELLFRVGRGETSDEAVSRAIDEALGEAERRWADPRQRALALITGHDASGAFTPSRVEAQRFRAWAKAAVVDGRLTIVDARR